ncbi:MAG: hypothetical protein NZT92_19990 [Abditibacteriales bacterium]|nr:hypothetical protein [Abditibacteriales bacterium]MDW8368013.1 carbohydrate binding domain-containing protein [Abditibacteriales bacterium]
MAVGHALLGLLLLICLSFAAAPIPNPQPTAPVLVLDDFERGVSKWLLNDHTKAASGQVTFCEILPSPSGAPEGGGKGGAIITFKRSTEGWATVSLPVDGKKWKAIGAERLSFWLRGDGSDNHVELMLRATSGGKETRFGVTVPLNDPQWHKVVLPFSRFKNEGASLADSMEQIYLVQFLKRSRWDSLFFTIDQIQVEGVSTTPEVAITPRPTTPLTGKRTNITVDFAKTLGATAVTLSVNFEGDEARLLDGDFQESLRNFGPRFVRVKAAALLKMDASGGTPTWDFTSLDNVVSAVRNVGAEPFICLSPHPEWKLTDEQFLQLCADTVEHLNANAERKVNYWEIFDAPTFGAAAISIEQATERFNRIRQRLKAIDPSLKIGGVALASAWQPHLLYFLKHAQGTDFLSFYFYGTHNGITTDAELFAAARRTVAGDVPYQIAFDDLRRAMAQGRWNVPVFITECSLNSLRTPEGASRDKRLTSPFSAAWWMSFLKAAGPYVNHVMVFNAAHESWGLLDEKGRAYPAYYALWLFSKFFPAGSAVASARSDNPNVLPLAVNTPTAHNVMLVNLSDQPAHCRVAARGVGTLRQVRGRFLEAHGRGVRFEEHLPLIPTQDVTLPAYAAAVVQFIEPPKPAQQ